MFARRGWVIVGIRIINFEGVRGAWIWGLRIITLPSEIVDEL
jgi:hypothetical protein